MNNWRDQIRKILLSRQGRIVLGVVLGIFVLRLGVNWWMRRSLTAPKITLAVVVPVKKTIDSSITLPGNIEAVEQASIYSHVSGYLKKLSVDEGDHVRKGQLLAEIDAPDVIQEYNKVSAEFRLKDKTRERYKRLLDEKVISQQEFDTVDAEADEAKARLENAQANVEYTRIRAPFSGSIARRYKYQGDLINAGARGGGSQTPIFLLVNEGSLRAAINVPQSDLSKILVGYPAEIRIDALGGVVIDGKVSRVDALLDEATKTQRVLIDIPGNERRVRAGSFATIVLHFSKKDDALTVPKSALMAEKEGSFIYVIRDKHIKRVKVDTGVSDSDSVEITQGVGEKEQVISKPGPLIQDGQKSSDFDILTGKSG